MSSAFCVQAGTSTPTAWNEEGSLRRERSRRKLKAGALFESEGDKLRRAHTMKEMRPRKQEAWPSSPVSTSKDRKANPGGDKVEETKLEKIKTEDKPPNDVQPPVRDALPFAPLYRIRVC